MRLPSTRYAGSKRKLAWWIVDTIVERLSPSSMLDAMGGTGSVAYAAKARGLRVTFNDALRHNYVVGLALIENSSVRLEGGDISLLANCVPRRGFIAETFAGIYYTDEENEWLDGFVEKVRELSGYKRALAMAALFQACLCKRPFNLFHRANLSMRLRSVERGFGNHRTWERPFPELFARFAEEYSAAVFGNGRRNEALNLDVLDVPEGGFDVVFLDPPYAPVNGRPVDYLEYYHFLEGLCLLVDEGAEAWAGEIDRSRKHLPMRRRRLWPPEGMTVKRALEALFKKFRGCAVALTYRADGYPPPSWILSALRGVKGGVEAFRARHRYALRRGAVEEVLYVAN